MSGHEYLSLFCLPYAGGSTAIYQPWHRHAPPGLEICPVELPGRGRRIREAPLASIDGLAADVVAAIIGHATPPFALFGHSMGATLAFECARLLSAHGQEPAALVVSGQCAPQLPPARAPIHQLDDDAFLHEVHALGGTDAAVLELVELRAVVLPILRADFTAIETYEYAPAPALQCPILAFCGADDSAGPPLPVRAWNTQTSEGFRLRVVPGGHFFIHELAAVLLNEIAVTFCDHRERSAHHPHEGLRARR